MSGRAAAAGRATLPLLVVNLWPSPEGSRTASQDPRRLAALGESALTIEQIAREHYDVAHDGLFA